MMSKDWSFGDWWREEGEERIREHILDVSVKGDIIDYKDEIGWWNKWFQENTNRVLYRIIWGDNK